MPYYHESQESGPDSKVVTMLQNILKTEITLLIESSSPSLPIEEKSFDQYIINVEEIIFAGSYSMIYLANHCDHYHYPLMARIFEPASQIDPHKCKFLRLLKHLGKRNPWLISTWGIYYDTNHRIALFQEFAIHGNLLEYVRSSNLYVPELQLIGWAQNIYNGMDFLGSIGLCHRSISPKHILLTGDPDGDKIIAKLGSFRDTIIYHDIHKQTTLHQRCRPLCRRFEANFHAPETYGTDSEEFNPISADVWSYGATLFYAGTRTYPYNYKRPSKELDSEIRTMIQSRINLSTGAKQWFCGLLRTDVTKRTPFDRIEKDKWFQIQVE